VRGPPDDSPDDSRLVALLFPRSLLIMPETISLYQAGVWLAVGFITGFGWAAGTALFARLVR